jgi:hypothetical protein
MLKVAFLGKRNRVKEMSKEVQDSPIKYQNTSKINPFSQTLSSLLSYQNHIREPGWLNELGR